MKTLLYIPLLLLFTACFNIPPISEAPLRDKMKEGKIVVKVCTRGCYQYVLESGDNVFFPVNLSDEFKILEEIPIRYTGDILESTTDITKPAPTDQPVYDFTCQDIELTSIERL